MNETDLYYRLTGMNALMRGMPTNNRDSQKRFARLGNPVDSCVTCLCACDVCVCVGVDVCVCVCVCVQACLYRPVSVRIFANRN